MEEFMIKDLNSFEALKNLNDSDDVIMAWKNIKENVKTSAEESLGLYELKQRKPRLDAEGLGFLDQRKQTRMQCLQDPNQSNVDNLNNVRPKGSRHFRNKKKEYMKAKVDELETNSKIKNMRCSNNFKKGYQPGNNIVNDEKGDLVTYSHRILARWRNHFSQLLNVHENNDVRQTKT